VTVTMLKALQPGYQMQYVKISNR